MDLGYSMNLMDEYDAHNLAHYPTPLMLDISSGFNQTATLGGGITANHEQFNNQ
jgi:hypothetical protein